MHRCSTSIGLPFLKRYTFAYVADDLIFVFFLCVGKEALIYINVVDL